MGKGNGKMEKFPYPDTPTTSDGAKIVIWVDTHITQGACAYPITSSTTMEHGSQRAVSNGKKNLCGDILTFLELHSEHSFATSHGGFALAGVPVSNFTSGQGLVLHVPRTSRSEEVDKHPVFFRWGFSCMKC